MDLHDLILLNELEKWLLSCAMGCKAEIAAGGRNVEVLTARSECTQGMCLFFVGEVRCVFIVQVNTVILI